MCFTLNLKKLVVSVVCLLVAYNIQAQKDTLYEVGAAEVVAYREKVFSAGTHSWRPDTVLLKQYTPNTLADVMGQTGMFVRTYSPGTLATPIMRGTYGVQTAIVWNGFNIQSPMNQLADMNLIPVFFVDALEVGYGSQSALYGSGAIGGTVSFGQTPAEKNGLHGKVMLGAGSFQNFQQGIKLSYKNKWYMGRVRYFNQTAQNTYTYTNPAKAGKPTDTMRNAQWWNNGQVIENYFAVNKHIKAGLHLWHTQAFRGVGRTMIQNQSRAFQLDDVWRLVGDVKYSKRRTEAIVRFMWFDERIRYTDSAMTPILASDNRAVGLVVEGEYRYKISNRHDVSVGLNNSNSKSSAVDYGKPSPVQYKGALFVSHRYRSFGNKLITSLTLRQEWVSLRNTQELPVVSLQSAQKLKILPFVPSIGAEWNVFRTFYWQAKASRLYRYPNFNDLYWNPGGNPNLNPENGYSVESRLAYKNRWDNVQANVSAGGYYNDITDWIIWLQGVGGIWTPRNIQRVQARGIETQAELSINLTDKSYLRADARYSYTVSTNEKKKSQFDDSYKKQLQYVPYHMAVCNIAGGYKRWYLNINGQYTGKQFVTSDNTAWLPAFYTLNVMASWGHKIKALDVEVLLQARNLFNKEYTVVQWVPMPGRNYQLTVQLNF